MNNLFMAMEAAAPVTITDVQPIIDALTAQISVSTIVAVLAGIIAVTIGIVFMWWVARKATGAIFGAFRKGKQSV